MADAIIELAEESEDTELEGVELLASYFDVVVTNTEEGEKVTFIPKPNIADMFDGRHLRGVTVPEPVGVDALLDACSGNPPS